MCPRCNGLVPPDSRTCPTCAYDPRTGRTVLSRPGQPADNTPGSAWSSVLAGVALVVAVFFVGVLIYVGVQRTVFEDKPIDRNFATESGTLPARVK